MVDLMWFGNKLVYFFGVERILDIGLLAIPHPSAVIFDLWWPVIILIMCWLVGYIWHHISFSDPVRKQHSSADLASLVHNIGFLQADLASFVHNIGRFCNI